MSLLPLLMEIGSLARALGWVPLAPKPWLLPLPAHESFPCYFLGSLTLPRTGNDVAEMQKTHPQTASNMSESCPTVILAPPEQEGSDTS